MPTDAELHASCNEASCMKDHIDNANNKKNNLAPVVFCAWSGHAHTAFNNRSVEVSFIQEWIAIVHPCLLHMTI